MTGIPLLNSTAHGGPAARLGGAIEVRPVAKYW